MENNLINTARSFFNDQTFQDLANHENLPVDQVKRSLDTAIPTLFLGLQKKSGYDLQAILNQLREYFTEFNFSDVSQFWKSNETELPSGEKSQHILNALFGKDIESVIPNSASFLGMDTGKLQNIFKAGLPAVIAALTGNGTNWDSTTIEANLNNNRAGFLKALPVGLPLNILGDTLSDSEHILQGGSPMEEPVSKHIVNPVEDVLVKDPIIPTNVNTPNNPREISERGTKKGGGLWWLLIPILLLLLWFLFGKGCNREEATITESSSAHIDSLITDEDVTLEDPISGFETEGVVVALPNNIELNANKGGIEDQLVMFLNSDYKELSDEDLKEKWFDFDNLNFETGTSNILPESQVQLDNLAAILNAYPMVKIKIGGYTDKTGDEAINMKISEERAKAVKTELEGKNLGDRVIETEGYGSEFANFEATAPETDRVKDRRVAISVRK